MRALATTPVRSCKGCAYLKAFRARPDEQYRYGFGEVGYGCDEPGYEGYVSPDKPICVRGPYLRPAIATETQRAETTKIGSVEDEGAGRQASPRTQDSGGQINDE